MTGTPFECPRCGAVSHNPHDVENRYCGRCHAFVDDTPRQALPRFEECPYCGGTAFNDGPRGGASINVECAGCGARFNVVEIVRVVRFLSEELSGPTRSTGSPGGRRPTGRHG